MVTWRRRRIGAATTAFVCCFLVQRIQTPSMDCGELRSCWPQCTRTRLLSSCRRLSTHVRPPVYSLFFVGRIIIIARPIILLLFLQCLFFISFYCIYLYTVTYELRNKYINKYINRLHKQIKHRVGGALSLYFKTAILGLYVVFIFTCICPLMCIIVLLLYHFCFNF